MRHQLPCMSSAARRGQLLLYKGPVREWRMISIQQEKREKASPGYGVRSSTVSVLLCWRTASDCHAE